MLIWTSRNIPNVGLFSAYAEVFPLYQLDESIREPFLCLRRGVSTAMERYVLLALFSLPTQRCFCLRPSCRNCRAAFLCLRRGVSGVRVVFMASFGFSLPTQRCFRDSVRKMRKPWLFSAYAEVFPKRGSGGYGSTAFLCLRRGVSRCPYGNSQHSCFSLPTQRCFRD